HPGNRLADTGWNVVIQAVCADYRAGFRKSISLKNRQAKAHKQPRNIRSECRTAADRCAESPTQTRHDLASDEPIQQRPQQERSFPWSSALLMFKSCPTHIN